METFIDNNAVNVIKFVKLVKAQIQMIVYHVMLPIIIKTP